MRIDNDKFNVDPCWFPAQGIVGSSIRFSSDLIDCKPGRPDWNDHLSSVTNVCLKDTNVFECNWHSTQSSLYKSDQPLVSDCLTFQKDVGSQYMGTYTIYTGFTKFRNLILYTKILSQNGRKTPWGIYVFETLLHTVVFCWDKNINILILDIDDHNMMSNCIQGHHAVYLNLNLSISSKCVIYSNRTLEE